MSDLLVIDGSLIKVYNQGEEIDDVSKDAVVYPVAQDVAEVVKNLLKKNELLAKKVVGAGDMFVQQMLPMLQTAYFEGVEAVGVTMTQPLDEFGMRPRVADPYGDKIRARNELRGL